jgi:hypothetical protein
LNRVGTPRDKPLGCCGEACRGFTALRWNPAVPTLAQSYEENAAAYTRAAEQCDDPVFRDMLNSLALQWRLAAREEAAKHATQPKI